MIGEQSWMLPEDKGTFVPLSRGCTVAAWALERFVGLGPMGALKMYMRLTI